MDTARQSILGAAFAVVADDIPAGDLTVELSFLDHETTGPNQRVMAVFADGSLIEPRLDIWTLQHGPGQPARWKFPLTHPAGRLSVTLSGIGGDAILSSIVVGSGGQALASGSAAQMKRLRETLRDSRTRKFRPVHPGEVPFFNVDHSPTGAYSTFIYGMEDSGGIQSSPGRRAMAGDLVPHDGVIVAAKRGGTMRVMPFVSQIGGLPAGATFVRESEVTHTVSAATDSWRIPLGINWTHYSPYWRLPEIVNSTPEVRKRFSLPVTWIVFDLDNTGGTEDLEFLFSLKQRGCEPHIWGNFSGYLVDKMSALAVREGDAQPVSESEVRNRFGITEAHSAFLARVAPHMRKRLSVLVAHYLPDAVSELDGEPLAYAYTEFFHSMNEVLAAGASMEPEAIAESRRLDQQLAKSSQNPERKFLSAHALHSYQFNTILRRGVRSNRSLWTVPEGEYGYANTFDLTIDQVFFELAMHPWTVRNELDTFLRFYSYVDQVRYPDSKEIFPGGIGFNHDMGSGVTLNLIRSYGGAMTQEELQNWILAAGLYRTTTGDQPWLQQNRKALVDCLRSMQVRDDVKPKMRDGITTMLSVHGNRDHDITTYDAMDESLNQVNDSLYIAVKSFASYLALEKMFQLLGEPSLAQESGRAAQATADSVVRHWNPEQQYFPAIFDGKSSSRILPAIEGLVYPYEMGLRNEVSVKGPYGKLIVLLRKHVNTVLAPGLCLDPKTGGWWLSSTSQTTWQSKVYLAQYITEQILQLRDSRTSGKADIAHVSYQVLGAPAVGWSDQIRHSDGTAYGGRHYPRGVTSALWWLRNAE